MKLLRALLVGGLALYACGFCGWIMMFSFFTSLTATQVPFGGPQILQWQLGEPRSALWVMDAYADEGAPDGRYEVVDDIPLFVGGPVTWDGYEGPVSFLCGVPVAGGYLTSFFDDVRFNDRGEPVLHGGLDFGTSGQYLPVHTPVGGRVVYSAYSTVGYGELVVVESAGVQLYLAHLSERSVVVGDVVRAGDLVGVSGDTGNSTAPHVHLEARQMVALADGSVRGAPFDLLANFLPGQTEPCSWDADIWGAAGG